MGYSDSSSSDGYGSEKGFPAHMWLDAAVTSFLCDQVYKLDDDTHVGQTYPLGLPNGGQARCELLAYRRRREGNLKAANGIESVEEVCRVGSQQYAVWDVEGFGVVVAFRGSRHWQDWMLDAMIVPCKLSEEHPIQLHSGILCGATLHAKGIADVIHSSLAARQQPRRSRLLFTGHSLGGGYASVMPLVIMADNDLQSKLQFDEGIWAYTYGAPLVAYCGNEEQDTTELSRLLNRLAPEANLHERLIHFVHGADPIPRMLGVNLAMVKRYGFKVAARVAKKLTPRKYEDLAPEAVEKIRAVSVSYTPLGSYYLHDDTELSPLGDTVRDGTDNMNKHLIATGPALMAGFKAAYGSGGKLRHKVKRAVGAMFDAVVKGHRIDNYKTFFSSNDNYERAAKEDS